MNKTQALMIPLQYLCGLPAHQIHHRAPICQHRPRTGTDVRIGRDSHAIGAVSLPSLAAGQHMPPALARARPGEQEPLRRIHHSPVDNQPRTGRHPLRPFEHRHQIQPERVLLGQPESHAKTGGPPLQKADLERLIHRLPAAPASNDNRNTPWIEHRTPCFPPLGKNSTVR
ncbi:hypothetical protein AB0L82_13705 [Nocardia sp. NPDC052001]|uniref:hypothetical protein n=1 Tax=Nocardia sp. NPDC052001 TaxID=3154853 RepID=UPI003434B11B